MGLLNKVVKPYKLGKTLSKGELSKVQRCKHMVTKTQLAVKVLEKRAFEDAEYGEDFMSKVQLIRTTKHPNLIDIQDIIEFEDSIYLFMELVPGGTLLDQITQKGVVQEEDARRIFSQLLDGVDCCHRNGIFHRNITAGNVLLTADSNAKLAGFGRGTVSWGHLAKDLGSSVLASPACYAAPEVLAGHFDSVGAPADIWSLGVLLYLLVARRTPFNGTDHDDLLSKIKRGVYRDPLFSSKELSQFLRSILQVDPSARATIEELRQHAWMQAHSKDHQSLYTERGVATEGGLSNSGSAALHSSPKQDAEGISEEHGRICAGAADRRVTRTRSSVLRWLALIDQGGRPAKSESAFMTESPPDVIADCLGSVARITEGQFVQCPNLSWYKIVGAQTSLGICTAYIDLASVRAGVLRVQFIRFSGGVPAFKRLYQTVLDSPECQKLILDNETHQ